MTEPAAPGQPIIPPPDFPVVWENPEDAKLTWRYSGHATVTVAPLSRSVGNAFIRGFNAAFAHLGLPTQTRTLLINCYPYFARVPANMPSPFLQKTTALLNRVAPALAKRLIDRRIAATSEQLLNRLQPILARLDTYWQDELLPENRQQLAYFESCDLRGLSLAQLRSHLAEGLKRAERLGELHALAGLPAVMAMSLFEEFHQELFPEATSLDALRLIQGMDSETVAGDRALWALSRQALTMPEVRQVFAENAPEEVVPALEKCNECQLFLAELQRYLNQYGQRLNISGDLTAPSWVEAPAAAVACLQSYLHQSDTNPDAVQARLTAEREQAIAETRQKLADQQPAVRAKFEMLLRTAQVGASVKEDNHWIMQRLYCQMRQLGLAIGRRLSEAGMLPDIEDVFFMWAEELIENTAVSAATIQERKAARIQFSRVTPPVMLGRAPLFEPTSAGPLRRAIQKADVARPNGRGGNDSHGDDATLVRGQAASAGTVRGTARIILSLAEASKLQPGEVLVTRMTSPAWTPLFGVATAVVTDTGGVLSHCAVVAREYGIPAVVGTGEATQRLTDGQFVEVDGSAGMVRVISSPVY